MKFFNDEIILFVVIFCNPATLFAQVSSHRQDIIPLTMSHDAKGTSNTKLNVNGKNMYEWFDYPNSYGHVLSNMEQKSTPARSKEEEQRNLIVTTVMKSNGSAFCTSFDKIRGGMIDNFKDLKGKFLNELVYKVSECKEKLPGASKATLQEADNNIKCEQIFLKTQDYQEALLAFEKIKKELAPCHPKDWFVTEDFPGIRRGEKDRYFGFYNTRYKSDPGRMDIGLELVLNFDTYFVRMVFKKSN